MPYKHIRGLTGPSTAEGDDVVVEPKIGRPQIQMLEVCGINSWEALKCYVRRVRKATTCEQLDASRPAQDGRFRVVMAEDLDFGDDSEHRLFKDSVVARDTILQIDYLRLRDSERVEFTNCIIVGDLNISMSDKKLRKVCLDRCLVLGEIVVYGIDSSDCSLAIGYTNCFELVVITSQIKSIDLTTCKIPSLCFEELTVDDISMSGNEIDYARFCRVTAKSSRIDHEQFNLRRMERKAPQRYKTSNLPRGFFEFLSMISLGDKHRETLFQSFAFLRKHTALESDRRSLNTVRLIESSQYQRSLLRSVTVRLLGSLQKPFRILCAALIVFFLAALAYRFLPLQFVQGQTIIRLDFPTACYFSGVTMMTIGYGDIVPLGIARYLAIIESVLGIAAWSLYVVALVRKYID